MSRWSVYKEGGTVCDLVSGDQEERCPDGQCTKRGVQYVIWYQEIRRRGVQMVSVQRGGYSK